MSSQNDDKLPEMREIWQNTLNWQPNDRQIEQFQQVYQAILIGNRQQNLTRITTPQDFWEKHLWDSLLGTIELSDRLKERELQVIDIGTGAGFPGIPLAIAFPHWHVTLLDSTRKKIVFLESLIAKLNLQNVRAIVDRAENIGRHVAERETYDLATIRAVSQASVCAEYTVPLVKVNGLAILYRGAWSEEETASLAIAAKKLGSKINSVYTGKTPITQGMRNCIYLRKQSPTKDKFPRAIGTPDKSPL